MEKVLLGGWTCAKKEKAEGGVLAHSGGKGKGGGGSGSATRGGGGVALAPA
jgi:hypothetical protein